ncbi:Cytochrome c biogenesis protein CcsA (chloroplast) [Coccomyxa sp. Obi]|nr:Cytochrome c biogenesis protein CcsA [Coccomyxa sp. Obi]
MTLLDIQYMLGNLSFACLLAMVVWYWIRLTFSLNPSFVPVGTVGMAVANLSLAGLLLVRWFTSGHFPLSNLYESLLFLSWGFTAFHLIMEIISRSDLFGIVTSPVALLTHAFASFSLPKEMQKTTALVPALQSNWLMMHVTVMMISYVALISGSLLALAFLVVNYYDKKTLENASPALGGLRGLKNHSPGYEQGSARDRIGEGDHYVLSPTGGQSRFNMLEKGKIKHLLDQCVDPYVKEEDMGEVPFPNLQASQVKGGKPPQSRSVRRVS